MTTAADPPINDDTPGPAGTFAALALPEYRKLWIAGLLTFGAVPMQSIARGFLAFDLTGKNSALGIVLLGMGLPMLVLAPLGGVAADRFDKRLVLMTATTLLWAPAGVVAVLLLADGLEFWMLVVASVFQGSAFSLMGPVRMAMSAELVGRDLLANAIVLAQLSANGTRVLGPSIAGMMLGVSFLGATGVYLTVTALFTIGLLLVFMLPSSSSRTSDSAASEPQTPRTSPLADLRAGLSYVRSDPPVLWPTLMSGVVLGLAFPYVAFLPSLIDDVYGVGPGWLGALNASAAVGAVVASYIVAKRSGLVISDRQVTSVAVIFGVLVAVLGLVPGPMSAIVVILFAGASNAAFQALNNSLVLLRAEEQFHGRVQSLLMLGFSAFGIFAWPLGELADAIGLQETMVLMGATSIVAVLAIQSRIVRISPSVPTMSTDRQ